MNYIVRLEKNKAVKTERNKKKSLCSFSTRQKKVKITRKDDCLMLNPIKSITRSESINSKKYEDNHDHKNKYKNNLSELHLK
jgi:virulence-associated protein VagC